MQISHHFQALPPSCSADSLSPNHDGAEWNLSTPLGGVMAADTSAWEAAPGPARHMSSYVWVQCQLVGADELVAAIGQRTGL